MLVTIGIISLIAFLFFGIPFILTMQEPFDLRHYLKKTL